jgi:hypothetical protein
MLALLLAPGTQSAAGSMSLQEELGCTRPIRADVIQEITRRTGCVFESRILTTAEIWPKIENGDLDMTTSAIPTPAMANAWLRVIEDMRLDGTLRTIYRNRCHSRCRIGCWNSDRGL